MFDKHRGNKQNTHREQEPDEPKVPVTASAPAATTSGKSATIGPGIIIHGDISGSDNLSIEGQVKGSIQLDSREVTIGRSGKVQADVTAKVIRIAGMVQGDLMGTEKVIISGTGNVRGNVVAPRVVLEDGAIFKGSIDMDPGEPAKAESPKAATKPTSANTSAGPDNVAKTASVGAAASTAAARSANEDKSGKPDLALKSG